MGFPFAVGLGVLVNALPPYEPDVTSIKHILRKPRQLQRFGIRFIEFILDNPDSTFLCPLGGIQVSIAR